jgi:hypothetical protein
MCAHHSFVKSAIFLDGYNRVVLFSAMAHKENFDIHKSMLLAEAEADGDTGGFDMWRCRVVSDVTCRALSGLVALGRAMSRRVVVCGDNSLLDPSSARASGARSIWYQ